jgi:hypothetical protein
MEETVNDNGVETFVQKWKIAARAEFDAGLQRLRESQSVPGPITERDELIYRFAFRISWAHAVELVSAVETGVLKNRATRKSRPHQDHQEK